MKGPLRNRVLWTGIAVLACGAFLVWCCGGSWHAPRAAATGPAVPLQTDLWRLSLRTGFALAAIVVLILGCAAFARRFGVRPGRRTAGVLEVVDRLDLAPKRALYSVRVGGRVVLVGVTDTSITPVLEWSADESTRLYPPGTAAAPPPFASLLQGVVAKANRA